MDVLARQLDAFVGAWESTTSPPDLKPFLPAAGEIRRLTLVELIKVDLEYRWLSRDCPKRISEYFTEFPEYSKISIQNKPIHINFERIRYIGDGT